MAKKTRKTEPLSPLIRKGHARLVIVAGECPTGMTFSLSGASHDAGRDAEISLAEDATVSSTHATFSYRGDTLQVTDKNSLNGIYIRIATPKTLAHGDWFRVGGQFFRFEELDEKDEYPSPDGTLHFTSPQRNGAFRIVQMLDGGKTGLSSMSTSGSLAPRAPMCAVWLMISGNH